MRRSKCRALDGRVGSSPTSATLLSARDRPQAPDVLGVLADGAIAGELARSSDIQYSFCHPAARVRVQLADLVVNPQVGWQVGEVQVRLVVGEQFAIDPVVLAGRVGTEAAIAEA